METTTRRRKMGRPAKIGELVQSYGVSLLPSRLRALDWLVDEANAYSRGALVSDWIDREMKMRKGPNWVDEIEVTT